MDVTKFIISLVVCQLAGIIGSIFTAKSVSTWYQTLAKPSFNPPSWVFGPVWTILFVMMGIALYLLWTAKGDAKIAITLFVIQLVLNTTWSLLFFGLKSPLLAFIEIFFLLIFIFLTIAFSYPVSSTAAYLLVPYFMWVSFATILNFWIYKLN